MKDIVSWIKKNNDVIVTLSPGMTDKNINIDIHEVGSEDTDYYPSCSMHDAFDGSGKELVPKLDRMRQQLKEERAEFESEGYIAVIAWTEDGKTKPKVSVFDNKKAAEEYYNFLKPIYSKCIMEELDILREFRRHDT